MGKKHPAEGSVLRPWYIASFTEILPPGQDSVTDVFSTAVTVFWPPS